MGAPLLFHAYCSCEYKYGYVCNVDKLNSVACCSSSVDATDRVMKTIAAGQRRATRQRHSGLVLGARWAPTHRRSRRMISICLGKICTSLDSLPPTRLLFIIFHISGSGSSLTGEESQISCADIECRAPGPRCGKSLVLPRSPSIKDRETINCLRHDVSLEAVRNGPTRGRQKHMCVVPFAGRLDVSGKYSVPTAIEKIVPGGK